MKSNILKTKNSAGLKNCRVLALLIAVLVCLPLLLASCGKSDPAYDSPEYDHSGIDSSDGNTGIKNNDGKTDGTGEKKDLSEGANDSSVRKIIYNASISAETKEFDKAVSGIEELAKKNGGYVQSSKLTGNRISHSNGNRNARTAMFVLRIPVDKFEDFMNSVGDIVNVVTSGRTSDDITTKYYDTQARLDVLEAQKASLSKMLEESNDLQYLLLIQDKLYEVIYEIESIKTTLKNYDTLTENATVTIELNEVIEYTEQIVPPTTFGERIANAFKESWNNFADGFKEFLVWLVYAFPTILVLAVIFGTIACIVIAIIKHQDKKTAQRQKAYLENQEKQNKMQNGSDENKQKQ